MNRASTTIDEDDVMNTRMNAELYTALGSAFSATLLGVAVSDLERFAVLGDRLLEELRKRGVAVYRQSEVSARAESVP
jgi:hypothetical protein